MIITKLIFSFVAFMIFSNMMILAGLITLSNPVGIVAAVIIFFVG